MQHEGHIHTVIANSTLVARARPWLWEHQQDVLRAAVIPFALGVAWWFAATPLPALLWAGLAVYALSHLVLIGRAKKQRKRLWPAGAGLALVADASLAMFVMQLQPHLATNAVYPVFLLLALRALAVYRQLAIATVVPFLFGPAYLFTWLVNAASTSSLNDLRAQWLLLFASLGFGAIAIWSSATQQRGNQLLRQSLQEAQRAGESRITQFERTSNDLRARMREQYALEEGLRVITSTLSLDDVLSQIIDSAIQMLGAERVHGIVLSLKVNGEFEHRSSLLNDAANGTWAELFAQRAMHQQVPLIIADVHRDITLQSSMPGDVCAALSVPLFSTGGTPRGALTVVSTERAAFSSGDVRHMTTFATQAGIAIGNAEMHSQIRQQQDLLESVMHDMSDGLVVVNKDQRIILANPLGRMLLESQTPAMPVHEQMLAMAASMQDAGKSLLTAEIRLGVDENDDPAEVYRALASQVRRTDSGEALTAIVLHDITAQKEEEKARTEFISMVAHELRNPLNSLNGFVKIVLQGRAGALNDMQKEFLEIADNQIELLKGRISELLEFNRLDAGRLALNPQLGDLPMLITGTVTRLRLQAEQVGLELVNMVDYELPECYFDTERIGQVLTNLIENAFKATPPGGTVTVQSSLHEEEVWIRVCDTGVGIPAEEQSKIFNAFYRAHDRTSSRGNHLGLGLSICQQIVEGHKGRIWVESELGKGTCFTFALPLQPIERAVNG
jgi:signal transduction histidine kinase